LNELERKEHALVENFEKTALSEATKSLSVAEKQLETAKQKLGEFK
jgi:hypothetical protein